MKVFRISFLFLLLLLVSNRSFSQIGIGTKTPHQSSILDVTSDVKGFLPPRLTENEKNNISNPASGLIIYNKTIKCLETFNSIYWFNYCCEENISIPINSMTPSPLLNVNFESLNMLKDNNDDEITINGYVNKIISNEGNNNIFNEVHTVEGPFNTNSDTIFKLIENNMNVPHYSSNYFLKRTKSTQNTYPSVRTQNYLSHDITDISNQDFDIFIVMRFNNIGAQPNYASVFHTRKFVTSLNTDLNTSFQLGAGSSANACGNDYYGVRYAFTMLCGANNGNKIKIDDKFHVFNIAYNSSENSLVLYIDNQEIEKALLTTSQKQVIKELNLFSNRIASSASESEIASLLIYNELLSLTNRETVSTQLVCLYSEL
ncbi:MAG: hypothetical protein ACPGSD_15615 [Flavobacteriales bacterium]